MVNVALLKEQRVNAFGQADVPEMLSNPSFHTPLLILKRLNESDPIPSGTVVPSQADRVVSVPFLNSVVIATDRASSWLTSNNARTAISRMTVHHLRDVLIERSLRTKKTEKSGLE
jgi:hypothetical protein